VDSTTFYTKTDISVHLRTYQYGAYISYHVLKRLYEGHLTEARRLDDPQRREERQ